MARPAYTTSKPTVAKIPPLKQGTFAEARLNIGVVTMIDPADIPNGAFQVGKNITVRFDRTSRREGTVLLDPAKPNSLAVLGTAFIKTKAGTAYTFRFTATTIHSRGAVAWTALTGTTLLGTSTDRFQVVNVLDTIIFSNNGANVIQKIDPVANTISALGNAPAYRYITGFYNRAVGAALRGVNEVEVGWSADGIATQWDSVADESAGKAPILESPSDLSDFITGIFGFTNVMILLREQSIWLATKKPIPSDPFNFYTVFPGLGCDMPSTVAVIPNGIAWVDTRTATVWAYTPGGNPEPIGRNIEATLLKGINDPKTCFASYNGKQAEYTVCIPRAGSQLVTTWTYNFRTKAWAEGEYLNITSLDDIELATGTVVGGSLTIDELVGTIDQLLGTIDQLVKNTTVGGTTIVNTRLFGRNDGEILFETPNSYTDAGTSFETLIDSRVFSIPTDDIQVAELRLEFLKKAPGTMEILWSKDGGKSFQLYKTVPDTYMVLDKATIVKTFGPLKARNYSWRIRATTGSFDVISFEIIVSDAGKSFTST